MVQKEYPRIQDVKIATQVQLCKWVRFLRSPENPEESKIMDTLFRKYCDGGGMTPEISKQIGW